MNTSHFPPITISPPTISPPIIYLPLVISPPLLFPPHHHFPPPHRYFAFIYVTVDFGIQLGSELN